MKNIWLLEDWRNQWAIVGVFSNKKIALKTMYPMPRSVPYLLTKVPLNRKAPKQGLGVFDHTHYGTSKGLVLLFDETPQQQYTGRTLDWVNKKGKPTPTKYLDKDCFKTMTP